MHDIIESIRRSQKRQSLVLLERDYPHVARKLSITCPCIGGPIDGQTRPMEPNQFSVIITVGDLEHEYQRVQGERLLYWPLIEMTGRISA